MFNQSILRRQIYDDFAAKRLISLSGDSLLKQVPGHLANVWINHFRKHTTFAFTSCYYQPKTTRRSSQCRSVPAPGACVCVWEKNHSGFLPVWKCKWSVNNKVVTCSPACRLVSGLLNSVSTCATEWSYISSLLPPTHPGECHTMLNIDSGERVCLFSHMET